MPRLSFRNRTLLISAVVALSVLGAACGSSGDGSDPAPTATAENVGSDRQTVLGSGDPGEGEKLFKSEGCSACHKINRERLVGPGLAGIKARRDDAYIRKSITDPDAEIVDGFPNVMTSFSGLGDEKIDNLVAYLKTLD